ncbi:MAG: hypothetical protein AB1650_05260 [Candidatus Omnitrophota bacterium]
MFCAFHKERLANDKCSQCGVLVCSDCSRIMSGKVYCPNCLPGESRKEKPYLPRNPLLAALLGFFPGLGQVYNGQLVKGLILFFTCWLIIPWIYGVYDAYVTASHINNREIESNPSPALHAGCLVLLILLFGIFAGGPFYLVQKIPSLFERIFSTQETGVRNILQKISGAIQAYQKDNGALPDNVSDLYFGEFSYLEEMYCGSIQQGYQYTCNFSNNTYVVTALPIKQGLPGYRMTPGPVVEKF